MNRGALLFIAILLVGCLTGCTLFNAPFPPESDLTGAPMKMDMIGYNTVRSVDSGLLVPHRARDTLFVPGISSYKPKAAVEEAHELRLKARELAAQLLETRDTAEDLAGLIALPISFVNLDDFTDITGFGRYLGEAMFFEFDQRGVPTQEYRLPGNITMKEGLGEMALSRALRPISVKNNWVALMVGTYHHDSAAVFVNARLIRASDGIVLRTAQTILPMNNLIARMTTRPPKPPDPPKPLFEMASIKVSGSSPPKAPAQPKSPPVDPCADLREKLEQYEKQRAKDEQMATPEGEGGAI
jgi:hypothetical protein